MDWEKTKRDFKRYLLLERGLSDNSIAAYLNDVHKLQSYAELNHIDLREFQTLHIQQFLQWINKFSISEYSQARMLSGIKTFFGYLQIEHGFPNNPAELIETPRLSRKIPAVLSIEEIDQLIAAIDLSSPEGMRNKTILEILYGCGLRVSELCNLKISNLFLDV